MTAKTIKYKSILYVDDDKDDCQFVKDAFAEIGGAIGMTTVSEPSSISRAIMSMNVSPDLVIMAINRPTVREIERLEEALACPQIAGLSLLVLSSTNVAGIIDTVYDLGVKSFLVKPHDFKVLRSLLQSVLSHDWSGASQLARKDFVVTNGSSLSIGTYFTCFIVDDDKEDRTIFLDVLQELYPNIRYRIAFDGEDAISQLNDGMFTPDVIFLDLNMPRMNGVECLRAMRSMRDLDDSRIVIFTVSTDPQDMETTNSLGADRFVTKPSDFDSLVGALATVF